MTNGRRQPTVNNFSSEQSPDASLNVLIWFPTHTYSWIADQRDAHKKMPTNQKGYGTFETTVVKLLARRIQVYPDYFCLGIILKIILNNFQNNA